MNTFKQERQSLHSRLLDAVRECQTHLTGNQQQLASEQSSWVSCLCSQLETVLQHRLKKQTTNLGSFQLPSAPFQLPGSTNSAPTFWPVIRFHLTNHEIKRFEDMLNITNDFGRGRAWIRCSLNEGSLERYFHRIIENTDLLQTYYEKDAFLLDQEYASTLPHMAAGLSSIYFNLKFNDPSLNGSTFQAQNLLQSIFPTPSTSFPIRDTNSTEESIYKEASLPGKIKKRSGKKKRSNIISFGDDDTSFLSGNITPAQQGGPGVAVPNPTEPSENSCTTDKDSVNEGTESLSTDLSQSLCDVSINKEPPFYISTPKASLLIKDMPSHDIVMDDWSTRSSSVGGLMTPEDSKEHHVFVDRQHCDERTASTSSKTTSSMPIHNSLHGYQKEAEQLESKHSKEEKLSMEELQKALTAVMQIKEELTDSNKSLRGLLDSEMLLSAELRMTVNKLQQKIRQQDEEHSIYKTESEKNMAMLRKQLKTYVDDIKSPKKENTETEVAESMYNEASPSENETHTYEQKLTEVAEMHGELLELNERLQLRLNGAISLLKVMRDELTTLRGPSSRDDLILKIESGIDVAEPITNLPASHALLNIWIPSALRQGRHSHYVYQVYVRIGAQEWNVYRRYSQFYELHRALHKKYPVVETFHFPPKKVVGNKDSKFVEERRKKLQSYLRQVVNNILQNHEKIVAKPDKSTVITLLPFFSESIGAAE